MIVWAVWLANNAPAVHEKCTDHYYHLQFHLVAEVFTIDSVISVLCRSTVWLSTAPTQPLTHWYQVRCLLQDPVFTKCSETLVGCVHLRSNTRYVSIGAVSQSPCLSRRTTVGLCYQCIFVCVCMLCVFVSYCIVVVLL